MRDVGVNQMEDEGRVQEDCGKQVGCTEVRHFRECWESSGKSQLELGGDRYSTYKDIQTDLSFVLGWRRKSMAQS